jgi:hypothetical protein
MNTPIRISNVKPFKKNSLIGFFDLQLPGLGMILRGCMLHEREGKNWIGYPGRPYKKEDGSETWANVVDFTDNKTRYLFSDEVLPLVLRAFAGVQQ